MDAVVGQHDIDRVRQGCNQVAQERSSGHFAGLRVQFHIDKLGGAVDGNSYPRAKYASCQATSVVLVSPRATAYSFSRGSTSLPNSRKLSHVSSWLNAPPCIISSMLPMPPA